MTIGFYIHHTTISAGGIFTYSIGILKQLLKSPQIEKLVIITSEEVNDRLKEFTSNPKVEIANVNRKELSVKFKLICYFSLLTLSIPFRKFSYKFLNYFNPYSKILGENNISIFHVPVQYSPIYGTKVPVIITMHDLQEYHYPEFFNLKQKLHRKINNSIAIYYSNHIIVSFNHVKNDIIKYFNFSKEKVSVCPPPFAENWFLTNKESSWEELSKKFGLNKKYLLYPAATWKHKNHLKLIKVLKILIDNNIDISLVCTGNKTEHFHKIKLLIDNLNISESVHFLGIVSEQELIGLYKNSCLVVIPTLYEAGSGPLYEAMRYGIPVVCSNVTSLPETMGNNEFLFDPTNQEEMLTKIKSGIMDEEFRRKNIQNSLERMEVLQQRNYTENFLNCYKKVLN